jgi:hypothetical protein
MRPVLVLLIVLVMAVPLGAQEVGPRDSADGEASGKIESLVIEAPEAPQSELDGRPRHEFSLNLEAALAEQAPALDPGQELLQVPEHEYTVALWNAPMGRLRYEAAAMHATLGRDGLVHGGHMLGWGMATTALGDGRHDGLQLLFDGGRWSDLSRRERLQVGFDIALGAGILAAFIDGLD